MNCPLDSTPLVMSDRAGIEIDYCPQCRGVWLDRGELDKIIERSFTAPAPQAAPTAQAAPAVHPGTPQAPPAPNGRPGIFETGAEWVRQQSQQQNQQYGNQQQGYQQGHDGYGRKKKRESWLSELFD